MKNTTRLITLATLSVCLPLMGSGCAASRYEALESRQDRYDERSDARLKRQNLREERADERFDRRARSQGNY